MISIYIYLFYTNFYIVLRNIKYIQYFVLKRCDMPNGKAPVLKTDDSGHCRFKSCSYRSFFDNFVNRY